MNPRPLDKRGPIQGLLRLNSRYGPSDRSAPKVTFVTRLQPHQLPGETARQLPDLSTIIRVEPSSTGDSRLQGALPLRDSCNAASLVCYLQCASSAGSISSASQTLTGLTSTLGDGQCVGLHI